jgi:hypothetical protein
MDERAMIRDTVALKSLVDEWHALRRVQGKLQINVVAAFAHGAVWLPQQIADEVYALLLPFGFSVLEHTLQQIRDEGIFTCKSSQMKALMDASIPTISWSDHKAVAAGREIRNKLTHEQVIPPCAETFRILDAIERELVAWRVLDGPVKYELTMSVGRTS